MEFDISNMYTKENADELHKGDIVCVADTSLRLKEAVEKEELAVIDFIGHKAIHNFRFFAPRCYSLAYLVCPARNAEAYWGYQQGKAVEIQIEPNGLWHTVTDDEIQSTKDFWCHHAIRVKE